ncbi:MAG: FtsX-like permease family protein [Planctomycetes bacterium]|nr:FtsX-like permease family protein [Planctomycetota bacterium]
MNWIAWKMLTGDRAKYLGIVFGVAFGSLLIAHQTSIFVSLMRRTGSQILDVVDAEIWVMDQHTQSIDELWPLQDSDVLNVRGTPGVEWAVRFYKGMVTAKRSDGLYRQAILLGLDDSTLTGAPRTILRGSLADLRQPDAVIIDEAGYEYLFPGEPVELGRTLEMNDHRAVIVGICEASPPFQTFPILYTRYSQATHFAPPQRNIMPFVLAKPELGVDAQEACRRIKARTGLLALTTQQFFWKTIDYYLSSTGIPINFGITVALGFIVGTAIAGQTFYLFTIENLKQFGNLKAMGVTNSRLVGMILLQASIVGVLGFGIGIGGAAAFFEATRDVTHLAGFMMPWQIVALTGAAVTLIVALSSLLSMRKVLVLEPAAVFR